VAASRRRCGREPVRGVPGEGERARTVAGCGAGFLAEQLDEPGSAGILLELRTARDYRLPLSQFRALPETDRLLALALTLYEANVDPSHGQLRSLALDPDLADEWTHLDPVVDHAAMALALAAESKKDEKHPEVYRYALGLREGWESRKAAKAAAREAATSEG